MLESPSDIIYSRKRGVFIVSNLGNNTVVVIDVQTGLVKQKFGVPYQNSNRGNVPFSKSPNGFAK